MSNNNKKRIIKVLEILKEKSDLDHKISLNELVLFLQEEGIEVNNRKTLYDDFKVLDECGYSVEYDNGYYLTDAPFSLSEIKIIIDSLNSLRNLDDKFLNNLKNKLYSYISIYETKLLKNLEYRNKHSDKKFINRLEDTLNAINTNKSLIIKRNNKQEEIVPLFIYRQNDMYYLYYHYLNNKKIYHMRFDNISSISLSDKVDNIHISKSEIIENISASTNAYYSNKSEIVNFKLCSDLEYIKNRLSEDFDNIIFTKDGFSLKASINDAFFSKLTSYGNNILIINKDIKKAYDEFLNKIIIHNRQE